MERANWIGAPEFYHLNCLCATLVAAFGHNVYLVGSTLTKRDYRDVDIRVILDDAEYESLFGPGSEGDPQINAFWSLTCSAISEWLSKRSNLPIDFQIQSMTKANKEKGARQALGCFFHR